MKKYFVSLFGAVLALFGIQAHAALDASIALGLADVVADFTALLALVYPVMITITVGLVIFGLVKMFIHKSAGK